MTAVSQYVVPLHVHVLNEFWLDDVLVISPAQLSDGIDVGLYRLYGGVCGATLVKLTASH